jgi:hypothetical protein
MSAAQAVVSDEVVGLRAGAGFMHGGFGLGETSPPQAGRSGLGSQIDVMAAALEHRHVDYLAADAGSTDPGAFYLGTGRSMTHAEGIRRSFAAVLPLALGHNVPLLIGSCGMGGTTSGLDFFIDALREVAQSSGLHFELGIADSEVDRSLVAARMREGRTTPLVGAAPLRATDLSDATHIVAMQGTEPITELLRRGAQVVLCGRISDAALYAAVPVMRGIPLAQAWHLARVMDHANTSIEPTEGVATSVYGIAARDHFRVEATDPLGRVSSIRVAQAPVYENSSPFELREPPGIVDVSKAHYEQVTPGVVRVTGSTFREMPYSVKIEGAKCVGYRVITVAGMRDPQMLRQLGPLLERFRSIIDIQADMQGVKRDEYEVYFHVYGLNGVMQAAEPNQAITGHEACVIAETVAGTQELASAIANIVHGVIMHTNYPGRRHTGGNAAFPFSPPDIPGGPVYKFNIWHAVTLDDPLETCRLSMLSI